MLPPWKGGVLTAWPTGHIKGAVKMLRLCLVAAPGFEPGTLRVWTECSSQLSYAAMYCLNSRAILTEVFAVVNIFFALFSFLSDFFFLLHILVNPLWNFGGIEHLFAKRIAVLRKVISRSPLTTFHFVVGKHEEMAYFSNFPPLSTNFVNKMGGRIFSLILFFIVILHP